MGSCAEPNLPELNQNEVVSKLSGPVLVQMVEVANIGASAADPETADSQGPAQRCLKFAVSDGHALAYGIEHRQVRDLSTKTPAGCKLVLKDVEVRRGYLLLSPDSCRVLGGKVQALHRVQQAVYGPPPPSQNVSALSPVSAMPSPPARMPPSSSSGGPSSVGGGGGGGTGGQGAGQGMGRRSMGGTGSAPPLASPVLTQDVALPPEAAAVDDAVEIVEEVAGGGSLHVQGPARGPAPTTTIAALDMGMDMEDMGQLAGPTLPPEDGDMTVADTGGPVPSIVDIPSLLLALQTGESSGGAEGEDMDVLFPPGVCRIAHVREWSTEPTYSLRMFLCSPDYAREMDMVAVEEEGEGVEEREVEVDTSRGVWADALPDLIQRCMSGTAASVITATLDRKNASILLSARREVRARVQALADRCMEYAGRVSIKVGLGQGGQVVVTEMQDFVPV